MRIGFGGGGVNYEADDQRLKYLAVVNSVKLDRDRLSSSAPLGDASVVALESTGGWLCAGDPVAFDPERLFIPGTGWIAARISRDVQRFTED